MDKSFAYQHDFPPTAAYKNLNLNQTNSVSSKFVVKETQNVPIGIKKNEKQFYMSNTKTNKLNNIETAANKTPFHHSAVSELFDKKLLLTSKDSKSRSSAHGNTLSLRSSAYENSNESLDLKWIPRKQRMDIESKLKKRKKVIPKLIPNHLKYFFNF